MLKRENKIMALKNVLSKLRECSLSDYEIYLNTNKSITILIKDFNRELDNSKAIHDFIHYLVITCNKLDLEGLYEHYYYNNYTIEIGYTSWLDI